MQLRHRGVPARSSTESLVLPGKFCRETFLSNSESQPPAPEEHRDRAGHRKRTRKSARKASQIGEGDTPPVPAYAPQTLGGFFERKSKWPPRRLADLTQVTHHALPVRLAFGRRSETVGREREPTRQNRRVDAMSPKERVNYKLKIVTPDVPEVPQMIIQRYQARHEFFPTWQSRDIFHPKAYSVRMLSSRCRSRKTPNPEQHARPHEDDRADSAPSIVEQQRSKTCRSGDIKTGKEKSRCPQAKSSRQRFNSNE